MTCANLNPVPEAKAFRRSPAQVMGLARMGSAHPTRLSFLHPLLRCVKREGWRFDRPVWDINEKASGALSIVPPGQNVPIAWLPSLMTCRLKCGPTG